METNPPSTCQSYWDPIWHPGQWSFLVLFIGGRQHIITQLAIYKWYISGIYCQLGDYIRITYHLLREPETAIDQGQAVVPASQLVGKTAAKFLEDPSQASNVRDLLVSVLITETDETALNFTSSPREARNVMFGLPVRKAYAAPPQSTSGTSDFGGGWWRRCDALSGMQWHTCCCLHHHRLLDQAGLLLLLLFDNAGGVGKTTTRWCSMILIRC